jgi:hypothetical protein
MLVEWQYETVKSLPYLQSKTSLLKAQLNAQSTGWATVFNIFITTVFPQISAHGISPVVRVVHKYQEWLNKIHEAPPWLSPMGGNDRVTEGVLMYVIDTQYLHLCTFMQHGTPYPVYVHLYEYKIKKNKKPIDDFKCVSH